jgi:hypothetical protein
MFLYLIIRHEGFQLRVGNQLDLLYFMGRAKSIHAMKKGHATVERRHVTNDGQIMGLLHGKRAQNGPATGTDQHGITMVAVNGERFAGQRPTGHVYNGREQFAGNFVEIGDAEQQSLTGGIGGCQGARHESSMQSTG